MIARRSLLLEAIHTAREAKYHGHYAYCNYEEWADQQNRILSTLRELYETHYLQTEVAE